MDSVNVTEVDLYEDLTNIDTRFVTKTDTNNINNLYQKDEVADVAFLDYFVKIIFEDEIEELNGYQILPLAKINIQEDQIIMGDDFIPPLLDIKSDKTLYEIIKKIEKNLTLHSMQLEEYKLPFETIVQEPNYLKYMMALQALGGLLPKLKHMSSANATHPWAYYETLLQITGVLSTFSNRVSIFGKMENGKYLISQYDHLNIYKCFNEIGLLIEELLDAVIIGPDYILPFIKDESTFTLDCPVSIFQAKYRYFLSLKTPANKEKTEREFLEYAKIASSSQIGTITQRSLPGLPFDKYDMPIQGLPQNAQNSFFELYTDDVQWTHIQESQNITIEFEDAQEESSIELIILKK
jgi:type VI secretion system protein ImpJ